MFPLGKTVAHIGHITGRKKKTGGSPNRRPIRGKRRFARVAQASAIRKVAAIDCRRITLFPLTVVLDHRELGEAFGEQFPKVIQVLVYRDRGQWHYRAAWRDVEGIPAIVMHEKTQRMQKGRCRVSSLSNNKNLLGIDSSSG